jgi:hypothetical protein
MNRRQFLHATLGVGALSVAGCTGTDASGETNTSTGAETTSTPTATATPTASPTPTAEGPAGVYVQSFLETMAMSGMAKSGDYRFALMLTVPHNFWNVTGQDRSKLPIEEEDAVHLMIVPWDDETGMVLPESGLSVEIMRDGSLVSEEVIYPMLSQRMGFHYGGNFPLDGDGTYTVTVNVGGVSIRKTGSFAGRLDDGASAEIGFEWADTTRDKLSSKPLDQSGDRAAVKPMDMGMVPQPLAPEADAMPGELLGTGTSDDAKLVATALSGDSADRLGDTDDYLAVSARTPFNRLILPAMALSATVERDGETVYDGALERTLDSGIGYHYGAGVDSLGAEDEVTITVDAPPQLARHEGYERAFLQMDSVTV